MKIGAVKLYDRGFMRQPFAFGGEEFLFIDACLPDDRKCLRCRQGKEKLTRV